MKNEALWMAELREGAFASRHRRARMLKFGGKHLSKRARAKRAKHFQTLERKAVKRQVAQRRKWARGEG